MTSLAILFVSFAVVGLLGVQQFNVAADRKLYAVATSFCISAASLVQFKLLPGPTTLLDLAGYFVGSASGILASMWLYPLWFKRRKAKAGFIPVPASESATKLGETLRLSTDLADYSSRDYIRQGCRRAKYGDTIWWDTSSRPPMKSGAWSCTTRPPTCTCAVSLCATSAPPTS